MGFRESNYKLKKYVHNLAHAKSLNKTTLANINKIVTLMREVKNQAARKIQRKFRNRRRT